MPLSKKAGRLASLFACPKSFYLPINPTGDWPNLKPSGSNLFWLRSDMERNHRTDVAESKSVFTKNILANVAKIPEALSGDLNRISKGFVNAANKAIKKSQGIAAEKMKEVMGDMSGMMGGGK